MIWSQSTPVDLFSREDEHRRNQNPRLADVHVVEFVPRRLQDGRDVAETFAVRELGEGEGQELVEASESAHLAIAVIPRHTGPEFFEGVRLLDMHPPVLSTMDDCHGFSSSVSKSGQSRFTAARICLASLTAMTRKRRTTWA